MKPTPSVNTALVPVSCRFPEDRLGYLDVAQKRLGLASRSDLMRYALDRIIDVWALDRGDPVQAASEADAAKQAKADRRAS